MKKFFTQHNVGGCDQKKRKKKKCILVTRFNLTKKGGHLGPGWGVGQKKLGCIFCHSISNKGSVGQIEMIIRRSNYKMLRL